MFLNLLFKALKTDTSMKRVKAFVKRIVQICTMHQPAFICGVFYLLGELETSIPSLRTLLNTPEEGEDEGEEIFRDVLDEDEDEDDEGTSARQAALKNAEKTASESAKKFREAYDGRKRDPAFAYADRTCLWEILPFAAHFHPSVSLFANSYLHNTVMPPKPDLPLHTLSHFLDRFVYKNPRTSATAPKGASIMQPLAGAQEGRGMILSIRGTAKSQVPVNTEAFWKKKLEDVKADEVFFHKYFTQRGETAVAAKKRKLAASATNGDEEKDEEELEDEAEDEVWKALVGSKPELEMDLDGDVDADDFSDDGFEDIEDSDDGGEEEVVGTSEDGSAAMDSDEEEEEEEEEAESTQPVKPTKKAPAATEVDDSDDADSLAHEDADDVWDSDDSIELPMDVDLDLESDPDDADLDAAFEAELELANTMLNPTPSNSKSKSKSSKPKATSPPAFSNKKGKKRAPTTTKDKNGEEDSDSKQSKKKKRKLKHLPTFASADDYAYLLSD